MSSRKLFQSIINFFQNDDGKTDLLRKNID